MKDIFGDDDNTKSDSELFAQMLKAADGQIQGQLQVGDKIVAEVLSVSKDEVYVATGMLVDGMVNRRELCDEHGQLKYKVGDKVELFVTQVKNDFIRL
mgnify:FL=1